MFRDSARLYDLLYEAMGKDYESEARVLDDLIQAARPGASSLLDVACGTGAHLEYLRSRYEVVGLDIEPAMLAQARTRLPGVELVEADMRDFSLRRSFDAVVCLFSSIGYMASPEELDTAIGTMAAHLVPGGVLVVDGWVRPEAWRDPGSQHALAARTDDLAVARVGWSQREGNRTRLEMHHLIATRGGVEHVVEHHEMTLFTDAEYRSAFERAGLAVEVAPSPTADRDRYVGTARK